MRDKHALREALSQATADADSRAHKCDQLSAALRSLERERELQQHKALEEREQHIAAADMRLLQARADLEDTQEREAQLRREVCSQNQILNSRISIHDSLRCRTFSRRRTMPRPSGAATGTSLNNEFLTIYRAAAAGKMRSEGQRIVNDIKSERDMSVFPIIYSLF